MESTKVKEQDETQHCYPPAQKGLSLRNRSHHHPEQSRTEDRFDGCPEPGRERRQRRALTRIQESFCVHPRPRQKIGGRTPSRMSDSCSRPPPCHPLQAEIDGKGKNPHEHPSWEQIAASNNRQRQHGDRKPTDPRGTSHKVSRFDLFGFSQWQRGHSPPDMRTS